MYVSPAIANMCSKYGSGEWESYTFKVGKHQRLLTYIIITIRRLDISLSKVLHRVKNKNIWQIPALKWYDGQLYRQK